MMLGGAGPDSAVSRLTPPVRAAFAELYAKRPPAQIKPGLSRIEGALAALPRGVVAEIPCVIIGGTNGKGSTSGFLWRVLALSGQRVGLYTSPHLVSFSERVTVNGVAIDDDDLEQALVGLRAMLPSDVYGAMSFFEVTTLLALMRFTKAYCDFNVLEVGLGGRLDATNVCQPVCSAIVSIGMDHMEYLGPTLAHIAREKAGIMREGCPVFWGGGAPEADAVIRAEAARTGADLRVAGVDFGESTADEREFFVSGERFAYPAEIASMPKWLRGNFVLAMAMALSIDAERAREGLCRWHDYSRVPRPISLRARSETILLPQVNGTPLPLLFDVCHNVDGARTFARGLRAELDRESMRVGTRIPGIVSILRDKDVEGIIRELKTVLDPIEMFVVPGERSLSVAADHERIVAIDPGMGLHGSWQEALNAVLRRVPAPGRVVVCGSVYACGHVLSEANAEELAASGARHQGQAAARVTHS